jgi:hypothetical protein
MVSSDHPKSRKEPSIQSHQQQQQSEETKPPRAPRSFCGRFLGFMKQAWTGVKFALGKEYNLLRSLKFCNTICVYLFHRRISEDIVC